MSCCMAEVWEEVAAPRSTKLWHLEHNLMKNLEEDKEASFSDVFSAIL